MTNRQLEKPDKERKGQMERNKEWKDCGIQEIKVHCPEEKYNKMNTKTLPKCLKIYECNK